MFKNAVISALIASLPLQAVASECATDAMVVFDGSASMTSITFFVGATTRIQDARRAMEIVMPEVEGFRRVGLMIYGPGGTDSCNGIDLRFGPRAQAAGPIIEAVNSLKPAGLTPLSDSVQAAAEALGYTSGPGTIVLVTDGDETCGGSPCQVANLIATQAPDITVHVIGYRVFTEDYGHDVDKVPDDPELAVVQARCLADQTGGKYTVTRDVNGLIAALRDTMSCAVIGALPNKRKTG